MRAPSVTHPCTLLVRPVYLASRDGDSIPAQGLTVSHHATPSQLVPYILHARPICHASGDDNITLVFRMPAQLHFYPIRQMTHVYNPTSTYPLQLSRIMRRQPDPGILHDHPFFLPSRAEQGFLRCTGMHSLADQYAEAGRPRQDRCQLLSVLQARSGPLRMQGCILITGG